MVAFTFTRLVITLFIAYLCNVIYVIYHLFTLKTCTGNCIVPAYSIEDLNNLKVSVYVSKSSDGKKTGMHLLWDSGKDSVINKFSQKINVTLPYSTRRNGSMFAYVFVHPINQSPFNDLYVKSTVEMHELTKYAVPADKHFNLIEGNRDNKTGVPITHMHSRMAIYIAEHNSTLSRYNIPADIYHLLHINNRGFYMPLLYVDKLTTMNRHLLPITKNTSELPLEITFTPVTLGRLRIWCSVEQTLVKMSEYGFTESDLDDMKGVFTDTNLYFLAMTFTVALFHALFDVLAFKNDVSFWREKSSMVGMSTRTVLWRCVSTTIIFMYLLNEKTSLLVLVPAGVGAIIEFWKVSKAMKMKLKWTNMLPTITFEEKSESEKETEAIDGQAMRYLSYPLYPLLVCGAVYSLVYHPHKSWYSWIITSLVNGVYVFGFLFMLPQLFINYKLKSVAHLPWRAFTYKAFNTFIDDIFAFIIVMPTSHRLACFRDDVVFIIYLYQRWLYPVDKTRANEFGMTFEEREKKVETKKDK